jgi:hypothetical protein
MTAVNLARVATLALILAPALVAVAHADDEYGTGHEAVIRHAAGRAMPPIAAAAQPIAVERFASGQNHNVGAPQRDALIRQSATRGSIAVLVDVAQAKTSAEYAADGGYRQRDLIGDGGRQDDLARAIYRPGSGADF